MRALNDKLRKRSFEDFPFDATVVRLWIKISV